MSFGSTLAVCVQVASMGLVCARPTSSAPAVKVIIKRPALGSVTLGSCLGQMGSGALPVTAALMTQRIHSASLTGAILFAAATWSWAPKPVFVVIAVMIPAVHTPRQPFVLVHAVEEDRVSIIHTWNAWTWRFFTAVVAGGSPPSRLLPGRCRGTGLRAVPGQIPL